jgi:mono/diheme cytochrome c family protein
MILTAVATAFIAGAAGRARAAANEQIVKQGEYLATAGDCVSCHTAPGGQPFAGGLYMPTPFGEISTPNITPDKTTGIGDWSDEEFYRAMHEGIGRHNEYLYPVFPFPWFTKVTRDDVVAIKAYLFSLPAVNAPRKPLKLAFPFNIRESLLAWRIAFFKPATFAPDPQHTDQINRGAYLVEGLAHCGECHNRHLMFGASNWSGKLEGGEIEGWYAPNLTDAGQDSIAAWSGEQIAKFLKTGADPKKGVALGPMRETIDHSLSHLSDDDLLAMATYIKTATANETTRTAAAEAAPPARAGGEVYLTSCAFCHQPNGEGIPGMIPALAGNPAVAAEGPENVIRVVLGGLEASHGLGPMPATGQAMSDGDIAAVVNYVRASWGNKAPSNAGPGNVADLRSKTRTLLAGNLTEGCPSIPNPQLAKTVAGVRDQLSGVEPANMLPRVDAMLPGLKTSGASDDDIVNALTAAYCSVVTSHNAPPAQRAVLLGDFSVLVYGQLKHKTKPN